MLSRAAASRRLLVTLGLVEELHAPAVQRLHRPRVVAVLLAQRRLQQVRLLLGHLPHLKQAAMSAMEGEGGGGEGEGRGRTLPRMFHMTFSVQGGVVRDPTYRKYLRVRRFKALVWTTPSGICASWSAEHCSMASFSISSLICEWQVMDSVSHPIKHTDCSSTAMLYLEEEGIGVAVVVHDGDDRDVAVVALVDQLKLHREPVECRS